MKELICYCPCCFLHRIYNIIRRLRKRFTIKTQWHRIHSGTGYLQGTKFDIEAKYTSFGEHPYTWYKIIKDIRLNYKDDKIN